LYVVISIFLLIFLLYPQTDRREQRNKKYSAPKHKPQKLNYKTGLTFYPMHLEDFPNIVDLHRLEIYY